MMFTPDEMARITNGSWLESSPEQGPVCIGHDTRDRLDGGAYVAITGANRDGHDYLEEAVESGARMAIVEKPIEATIPCLMVDSSLEAIARLASHWRDVIEGTRVIAITGTAGKTSTKNLLHHVLGQTFSGTASPASWNNSIGVPMSLLRARRGDEYVILEVGTSSPGEIEAMARIVRPDIAIITLIGNGHLEGLASIEGVRREKVSLLGHVAAGGTAIVHDDGHDVRVPEEVGVLRHGISSTSTPCLSSRMNGQLGLRDGSSFAFSIPGPHQATNALAVIAASRLCGMTDPQINVALQAAGPSDGRGAMAVHGGVMFINDAYNANPDSVAAALATLPEFSTSGRRIVILGDMLELGACSDRLHLELKSPLIESHGRSPIDLLILVGEEMAHLQKSIACEDLLPMNHWNQLDDRVVAKIADQLSPGDLVLLKGSRGMRLERIIEYVDSTESEAARA